MALVEYDLFGQKRDKVQTAIDRLRAFEPQEGYFLAFSGGKDSQCIYHLAKMAGVKFDAHYQVTSVDPPELVQFIKAQYPDVHRDIPHDKDGKPVNDVELDCAAYDSANATISILLWRTQRGFWKRKNCRYRRKMG